MRTTPQGKGPEHVLVCVDGPNADNQAAAWGAWHAFDSARYKLAGIVISGTCVDNRPRAYPGSRDNAASRQVQELHTARMAGLFKRAGSDVPVFIGKPVAETDITTPIPHKTHVRHEDYDIYGDSHGAGRRAIAGNFQDALAHIASLNNTVHVVVGGPFTEIPHLIDHPVIAPKLGHLAAQAGFEIASRPIYSKLAFNVDVDMVAALKTLLFYPGKMYNVPSDITRNPKVTYPSAEALLRLGIHPELGEIFIRHRARAEERHKLEQIQREAEGKPFKAYPALSLHDLQAVMALQQALGEDGGIFTFHPMPIPQAISNMVQASELQARDGLPRTITTATARKLGYRGNNQTTRGTIAERFVVTSQDADLYKRRVPDLIRTKRG